MIPTTSGDIQRSGNMTPQQTVTMTFDENSIAHIMSVLTDLYSDPEMAIIREYATNARDSHIEAGQTRPIEITLPSSLVPMLKIKDYGVGLSVDDIENIYSKYGASTKRGTNDQTGLLGLGCKSGLTYASQFTLIGIKHGVKTTVVVARAEDGTGSMEIIDTCVTTDPDGVEVTIPTKRDNQIAIKAEKFFRYWDSGTVLVNGKPNVSIKDSARKISDTLFLIPRDKGGNGNDYIVMGGVAYKSKSLYDGMYRYSGMGFSIVAFVPMGSVNFTPSREQLHYTRRTESTIEAIQADFKRLAFKAGQETIDASPSLREATKAFIDWKNALNLTNFTYNGKPIATAWKAQATIFNPWQTRYASRGYSQVDYSTLDGEVLVVVVPAEFDLNTSLRKKIRRYLDESDKSYQKIIFAHETPWDEAIEVDTIDLDVVKAIKLPRNPTSNSGRYYRTWAGTYDVYTNGVLHTVAELPDDKPIIFYGPREDIAENHNYLGFMSKTVTVVCLNANRWDKFKRENSDAMHVKDWVRQESNDFFASLTPEERFSHEQRYNRTARYELLDPTKIDDPDLVTAVRTAKLVGSADVAMWAGMCQYFNIPFRIEKSGLSPYNLSKHYPLTNYLLSGYSSLSQKMLDDLYLYMNTKYAQEAASE